MKLKLNNRMSFFRGCDLVNTFKVIIGFILQIHMHFDVCSVLTSNQKQLQLEVEQNDSLCESVYMPLRLSFDEY